MNTALLQSTEETGVGGEAAIASERVDQSAHLILSEVFPPGIGGSGRWLWEAYRRLPWKKTFLVPEYNDAPAFDGQHSEEVHRTRFRLASTGGFSPTGFKEFRRLVRFVKQLHKQHKFSLLHCGCCITPGWVGLLFRLTSGVPYVVYVHGEEVHLTQPVTGLLSSRQHRWMTGLVLKGAKRIIANSENTRQILKRDWNTPEKKVSVIHPGVDADYFVPAERCENTRNSLGWTDRRVVLTVSRLQERKGQDMFLRALPDIRRAIPDILYVIVGDGEDAERLGAIAKELDLQACVQFHPQADHQQLLTFYQQCDLFALPNRQVGSDVEGFGLVLLEAQACGKPVLAGDSGGTRETLLPGETGVLVKCDSPEPIAKSVIDLLGDKARLRQMGERARQWAASHFDWNSVASKTNEEISRILN